MGKLSKSAAARATAAALRRVPKPENFAVELICNPEGLAYSSRLVRLPRPLKKGTVTVSNKYAALAVLPSDSNDKEADRDGAEEGDDFVYYVAAAGGDGEAEIDGAADDDAYINYAAGAEEEEDDGAAKSDGNEDSAREGHGDGNGEAAPAAGVGDKAVMAAVEGDSDGN
jgi:hypothetical protein